jgi:hypothetical protein
VGARHKTSALVINPCTIANSSGAGYSTLHATRPLTHGGLSARVARRDRRIVALYCTRTRRSQMENRAEEWRRYRRPGASGDDASKPGKRLARALQNGASAVPQRKEAHASKEGLWKGRADVGGFASPLIKLQVDGKHVRFTIKGQGTFDGTYSNDTFTGRSPAPGRGGPPLLSRSHARKSRRGHAGRDRFDYRVIGAVTSAKACEIMIRSPGR